MTEQERYEQVDLPFYRSEIAPVLPARVLDFHVHTAARDQLRDASPDGDKPGAKYMVTEKDYPVERLLADRALLIPDRPYGIVCFGWPGPAADPARTNAYARTLSGCEGLYPLLLAGNGLLPVADLRRGVLEDGAFGYKVFMDWVGDNYGDVTIEQMLGTAERQLANELGLVILLHVPRSGRLTDPVVQAGVRKLAGDCHNARIVLAHCGRCYLPDEMARAVDGVADLDNVCLDTAMVMDPTVIQIVLEKLPARRLVYATDLPIAQMRGRRVYVMDHWVDVVLEGYPASAYRMASDGIRASFMVYEIILAIRRAAERVGLAQAEMHGIFYDNGMSLLAHVRDGRQLAEVTQRRGEA
jgi:hypothetical protein